MSQLLAVPVVAATFVGAPRYSHRCDTYLMQAEAGLSNTVVAMAVKV